MMTPPTQMLLNFHKLISIFIMFSSTVVCIQEQQYKIAKCSQIHDFHYFCMLNC